MTDNILKEIEALNEKMDRMMEFIASTDKIKNSQLWQELNISDQTLYNWFTKGCPRIDDRHVSRSAVKKWRAEQEEKRAKKV